MAVITPSVTLGGGRSGELAAPGWSGARLRILHISDLHADGNSAGPLGWRRRRVLGDAWAQNLDAILEDGPLDLVCFTGDLAQSGKAAEYAGVTPFVDGEATPAEAEQAFQLLGCRVLGSADDYVSVCGVPDDHDP